MYYQIQATIDASEGWLPVNPDYKTKAEAIENLKKLREELKLGTITLRLVRFQEVEA